MSDEALASKFRRLVELRDERDQSKVTAECADRDYRTAEAELWDELDDSPVRGARRVDLGPPHGLIVFTPRQTHFGRVLDTEQALEYFEQRAMSDEMTRPQIAKRKLNELVREHIESGKPLPAGIDFYTNRGITISKK